LDFLPGHDVLEGSGAPARQDSAITGSDAIPFQLKAPISQSANANELQACG